MKKHKNSVTKKRNLQKNKEVIKGNSRPALKNNVIYL